MGVKFKRPRSDEDFMIVIEHLIDEKGFAPTIREIGDAIGLTSTSTVHARLQRLRSRGWVTWSDLSPRTLRVTREPEAE